MLDAAREDFAETELRAGIAQQIANCLDAQRRYSESEPFYREALEAMRQARGADYPGVAMVMNDYAWLLGTLGKKGEQVKMLRQAVDLYRKRPGHHQATKTFKFLATVLFQDGKRDEAIALFRELVEIVRETGMDARHLAGAEYSHAFALQLAGRLDDAERVYGAAVRSWRRVRPPHAAVPTLRHFGLLLAQRGKYQKAEKALKRVLRLRQQASGAKAPRRERSSPGAGPRS